MLAGHVHDRRTGIDLPTQRRGAGRVRWQPVHHVDQSLQGVERLPGLAALGRPEDLGGLQHDLGELPLFTCHPGVEHGLHLRAGLPGVVVEVSVLPTLDQQAHPQRRRGPRERAPGGADHQLVGPGERAVTVVAGVVRERRAGLDQAVKQRRDRFVQTDRVDRGVFAGGPEVLTPHGSLQGTQDQCLTDHGALRAGERGGGEVGSGAGEHRRVPVFVVAAQPCVRAGEQFRAVQRRLRPGQRSQRRRHVRRRGDAQMSDRGDRVVPPYVHGHCHRASSARRRSWSGSVTVIRR